MKTVSVQIGNSDNKLTQRRWSEFIKQFKDIMHEWCSVHFCGGSHPDVVYQNYCIVGETHDVKTLKNNLSKLCEFYDQDSIAYTEGDVEFIKEIKNDR